MVKNKGVWLSAHGHLPGTLRYGRQFTFREHMTAGMAINRDRGEKMPHKMAVMSDRVMKSFGVYSYFGG